MVLKCFSCYGGEPKGKESPPSHHPPRPSSPHQSPRPSSYEEQQVSDESPRASDEEQQVSHEERQEESVVVNVEQPIVVIEDVAADIIHFPFEVILKATDAFQITNLLGRGGFGAVYAGKLSDGQDVAVKRVLGNIVHEKISRDAFLAEMSILKLQRMRHPNIIRLIGYYVTHNEMILVLERMAEGTLSSSIHDLRSPDEGLTWSERLTVARGIANALAFLHSQDIIYRDLKPDNVLLNREYSPKLTDFGLSMHLEDGMVYDIKNAPPGTCGYMDPAFQKVSTVSLKSDVYSFGLVLLSLLTGRKAVVESDADIHIVDWAQPLFNHDFHGAAKLAPVVQRSLGNGVEEVLHIAQQCVQDERDVRPSMAEVVQLLSGL